MTIQNKTALLSSYKKDEPLIALARLLSKRSWKILASSGTAAYLKENSIPATDIASIVGPPILGHRVVTLSREIHAALLSATSEDSKELERLGIMPIDLVYVILYPLEETIRSGGSPEEVREKTDIGGPALLCAAAKGKRIALSAPEQVPILASWLEKGATETERRGIVKDFSKSALRRVADYAEVSAKYWGNR